MLVARAYYFHNGLDLGIERKLDSLSGFTIEQESLFRFCSERRRCNFIDIVVSQGRVSPLALATTPNEPTKRKHPFHAVLGIEMAMFDMEIDLSKLIRTDNLFGYAFL